MNNVIFNSILIVDIYEKTAKYQYFSEGVNIVTSKDNHVGKSSLLKSLYYSIGAEVQYDDLWQKSTKLFVTRFSVGKKQYTLTRSNNRFVLLDNVDNILVRTDHVTNELSPILSEVFDFKIYLTDKKGKTVLAPPVFSYLPYYLDQDRGWGNEPFVSFLNLDQFRKNKRLESLYYHLNVYSEQTQRKQLVVDNNKEKIINKKGELQKNFDTLTLIEEQSSYSVPFENEAELDMALYVSKDNISAKVKQLSTLREKMYRIEYELIQYEKQKQVVTEYSKIEKNTIENTTKANALFWHTCPNCGYSYEDNLFDLVLSQYGMQSEKFVERQIEYMINQAKKRLEIQKEAYITCSNELITLEKHISEKEANFNSYLVAKGSKQTIIALQESVGKLTTDIKQLEKENKEFQKEINNLVAKKEADKYYRENLRSILIKFGAWDEKYDKKLMITKPLNGSGTLSIKIILADYIAIFKTIEEVHANTPRFPLVVDSPRTKEPSIKSSKLILDAIINMSFTKQTILATMDFDNYLKDYQDIDIHIIRLDSPKALLNKEDYIQYAESIDYYFNLLSFNK